MAAFIGRTATFGPNSTGPALSGVQTKNFTIGGEPIDISDDDSNGFAEYLAESGRKELTIAVSGLTKDKALLDAVGAGGVAALTDYTYEIPSLQISWTGDWVVSGVELQGEHEGAMTFSATIQSNGAWVYDDDTSS